MDKILENSNILISAVCYVQDLCKDGIKGDMGKMKALHFLVVLNDNRMRHGLAHHHDIFGDAGITKLDKEEYYKIIEVLSW